MKTMQRTTLCNIGNSQSEEEEVSGNEPQSTKYNDIKVSWHNSIGKYIINKNSNKAWGGTRITDRLLYRRCDGVSTFCQIIHSQKNIVSLTIAANGLSNLMSTCGHSLPMTDMFRVWGLKFPRLCKYGRLSACNPITKLYMLLAWNSTKMLWNSKAAMTLANWLADYSTNLLAFCDVVTMFR